MIKDIISVRFIIRIDKPFVIPYDFKYRIVIQ